MSDLIAKIAQESPDWQRTMAERLPKFYVTEGLLEKLELLLTTFLFMEVKIRWFGPQDLIKDYDLVLQSDIELPKEKKSALHLIQRALQMSAHILIEDNTQLAAHLHGRLLSNKTPEYSTASKAV